MEGQFTPSGDMSGPGAPHSWWNQLGVAITRDASPPRPSGTVGARSQAGSVVKSRKRRVSATSSGTAALVSLRPTHTREALFSFDFLHRRPAPGVSSQRKDASLRSLLVDPRCDITPPRADASVLSHPAAAQPSVPAPQDRTLCIYEALGSMLCDALLCEGISESPPPQSSGVCVLLSRYLSINATLIHPLMAHLPKVHGDHFRLPPLQIYDPQSWAPNISNSDRVVYLAQCDNMILTGAEHKLGGLVVVSSRKHGSQQPTAKTILIQQSNHPDDLALVAYSFLVEREVHVHVTQPGRPLQVLRYPFGQRNYVNLIQILCCERSRDGAVVYLIPSISPHTGFPRLRLPDAREVSPSPPSESSKMPLSQILCFSFQCI